MALEAPDTVCASRFAVPQPKYINLSASVKEPSVGASPPLPETLLISVISLVIYYNYFIKTEKYTNLSANISSYYTQNNVNMPITGSVAKKGTKNFGNFGKFGNIPMIQYCTECKLNENCVTADYRKSKKMRNVCLKCGDPSKKNYHDLNKPIFVGAKSVGRVRQCRQIN